jgi:hypothetical protein
MKKRESKATGTLVCVMLCWALACSYPQKRWDAFVADVRHKATEPRTPEGKCSARGGVLHNEQCYIPNPKTAGLDKETCRLRGGLYIAEQCLEAPQKSSNP